MGLKTNNYVSKSTGIVLPEAYAGLTNLIVEKDNRVRAIFGIQSSRTCLSQYTPIDTYEINFEWDRKTDPAVMAYEQAKTEIKNITKVDETTGEEIPTIELGLLYDWEDYRV